MNHEQILETLRSRIWTDLGLFFVDIESDQPRPPMPFISRKFTSPYIPQPKSITHTLNGDNVTLKQSSQPKMTLSMTVYAKSQAEALGQCMKLKDWFDFVGADYLADNGLVVVSVENMQDRTILMETEFEYRCGFDVIFRVTHEVTKQEDWIEIALINE